MKFDIKVEPDINQFDKVFTFSGEFTQSELIDLNFSRLERRVVEMVCDAPSDALLALGMIYRRYEERKND